MQYFILPVILTVYFEVLGQSVLSYLKLDRNVFNYGIGFIFILASCYIFTSILTALDCSFYLILSIYAVLFLLTLVLIFKERKSLKIHFTINHIVIASIIFGILMYFSLNTSLGELSGFDSTHYLNMVSGNAGQSIMNQKDVMFGDMNKNISKQYTFQSYFYLASSLLFVSKKIFNFLGIEFFYPQGFIWCFQTMFHLLLISIVINVNEKYLINRRVAKLLIVFLIVFCYGKLYFNSVFGFYGNSLRTLFVAYAIYYLYEYFKNDVKKNKMLFTVAMLAACASSSTGVFIIIFTYFALFFVEIDYNDNIIKEYSLSIFIPMINLFSIFTEIKYGIIIASIIVFILSISNNTIVKIIRRYSLKKTLLVLCVTTMFFLSLRVTQNIMDFSAFLDNNSEVYDMTLDYFDFERGYRISFLYKLISLITMLFYILFGRKEKYAKIIIVLILVIFNPFCCSFLNSLNGVYYRAYEIILNPFTLILFTDYIIKKINNKYIYMICASICFIYIGFKGTVFRPLYWHDSFIPSENYNVIYKMTEDEINIIREIQSLVIYDDIKNPKIVTPNLLTQSMIPSGIYFYGREYKINSRWTSSERAIYDIFWPVLHFGDGRQPDNPDYNNMCKYIDDAEIDFIVQPKSTEYYDKDQNIWYSLTYKIDECGNYAFYDTENYSVYYYER